MTAEEHLRAIVADLIMQLAILKAQVDTLQARIVELDAKLTNGAQPG
jgi:prefoldin subunit 5